MENASKALIMAGGMLIALMIIGALILMFSNLSNYQQTRIEGEVDSQVVEFNNQFSTYNRPDVRGSELYSLLNRAINYNRTQSTAGTSWADQGKNLAYEPVTIHFTMDIPDLSADGTNRLFTKRKLYNFRKYE